MMEKQENTRIITLLDLWEIFVQHIFQIIVVIGVCVALIFAYSKVLVTPEYNSTSTLYILKQDNSSDYVYTQSDFTLALNIVNDCTYMIKSHEVLDDVIAELHLDCTYKELYKSISVGNPDNTRILEVTVRTENPTDSKRIVDHICSKAAAKINETMGTNQVSVYARGTVENRPSNTIGLTKYFAFALIAGVVTYVVYFIVFVLDDKIKTTEDVAKYLGLSVLGEIPNSNDMRHRKNRYKGYYYSYGNNKHQKKNKRGGKEK